jgi:hypothetical protein
MPAKLKTFTRSVVKEHAQFIMSIKYNNFNYPAHCVCVCVCVCKYVFNLNMSDM